MHDHHHYVRFVNGAGNFSYYFIHYGFLANIADLYRTNGSVLSPRSQTRVIAYNFNHNVQYRIIKKKKNILHYITRTSRALRGQGSINACVRMQWRRHVPRPPPFPADTADDAAAAATI